VENIMDNFKIGDIVCQDRHFNPSFGIIISINKVGYLYILFFDYCKILRCSTLFITKFINEKI